MASYGTLLPANLREELRVWRNKAKMTCVTIVHSVVPTSGAGVTEMFPDEAASETLYHRSGALGFTPAESRELGMPGGWGPGGGGRVVFDGLDTGASAYNVRRLITGADSIYAAGSRVEVSFEVDGRRYLAEGLTHIPQTDELIVELHFKENLDG